MIRESFKRLLFCMRRTARLLPWQRSRLTDGYRSKMDYIPFETMPHYTACLPLVSGLGYGLAELRVIKSGGQFHVRAVITGSDIIGIDDCSRVHRLLLPRLEAVLHSQDIYMEVTSPGTERVIKNAAEFALFDGKYVKVWHTEVRDWIKGRICSSDSAGLTLETDGAERYIPYGQIAKAKLFDA